MKKAYALILLPMFLLSCSVQTLETDAVDRYYKVKSIYLAVAEEAYEYANNPATPQEQTKSIRDIGIACFDAINRVDEQGLGYTEVTSSLILAISDLYTIIGKKGFQVIRDESK